MSRMPASGLSGISVQSWPSKCSTSPVPPKAHTSSGPSANSRPRPSFRSSWTDRQLEPSKTRITPWLPRVQVRSGPRVAMARISSSGASPEAPPWASRIGCGCQVAPSQRQTSPSTPPTQTLFSVVPSIAHGMPRGAAGGGAVHQPSSAHSGVSGAMGQRFTGARSSGTAGGSTGAAGLGGGAGAGAGCSSGAGSGSATGVGAGAKRSHSSAAAIAVFHRDSPPARNGPIGRSTSRPRALRPRTTRTLTPSGITRQTTAASTRVGQGPMSKGSPPQAASDASMPSTSSQPARKVSASANSKDSTAIRTCFMGSPPRPSTTPDCRRC